MSNFKISTDKNGKVYVDCDGKWMASKLTEEKLNTCIQSSLAHIELATLIRDSELPFSPDLKNLKKINRRKMLIAIRDLVEKLIIEGEEKAINLGNDLAQKKINTVYKLPTWLPKYKEARKMALECLNLMQMIME